MLILALMTAQYATAIGVSPGTVAIDNMVRGGYAERTLMLSTAGNQEITFTLQADGEIKDWISFVSNETQLVLRRKSALPIKVRINVSSNAQGGQHDGRIIITTLYTGNETVNVSGARFMPGLIVRVTLNVTDVIIRGYAIRSLSVKNTEQDYPVEFTLSVENTGNVIVTPNLRITLLDSEMRTLNRTLDYHDTPVLPTIIQQFFIQMPTKGLRLDDYYANVTSDLGYENMLSFKILPQGTYLIFKGILDGMSANTTQTAAGENVNIMASFRNDGDARIEEAKLKAEVYLTSEEWDTKKLAGVIEGKPRSVEKGENSTLSAVFTPKQPGTYLLEGVVVYSGKRTDVKTLLINVKEPKRESTQSFITLIMQWREEIGGVIAIIAVAALIAYLKRRQKNKI